MERTVSRGFVDAEVSASIVAALQVVALLIVKLQDRGFARYLQCPDLAFEGTGARTVLLM